MVLRGCSRARVSQIWDRNCRKNEARWSGFVLVLAQQVILVGWGQAADPCFGLAVVAAIVRLDALLGLAAVEPDKASDGGGLEGAFLFGGAFAAHGWMVAGGRIGFEAVLRLRGELWLMRRVADGIGWRGWHG